MLQNSKCLHAAHMKNPSIYVFSLLNTIWMILHGYISDMEVSSATDVV